MRGYLTLGMGLALGLCLTRSAWADEPSPAPTATLGRPVPLVARADYAAPPPPAPRGNVTADWPARTDEPPPRPSSLPALGTPRPIVRAQAGGPPPIPPPPDPGVSIGGPAAAEALNCGVIGRPGGFFNRCGDSCKEWWHGIPGSVTGIFQPGPSRGLFQSDTRYCDKLISPVTSPFRFEDPRALTEVRPLFIWQHTPSSNPVYAGGNNFWYGLRASLAVTDWFTVVIPKLGFISSGPNTSGPTGEFSHATGFAEFDIGPKITFIHLDNFLAAAGVNFELPVGGANVFQDTGSLSIDPYLTFGVNFGDSRYGAWIFQTTAGYSFSVNRERTEFFYGNFHLSYDVANLHKLFPLVEMNWTHYTVNGQTRDIGFEGNDLFNFGSNGAAGHDDLILNFGFRYKFTEHIQFGIAAGFSIVGAGRHMDAFRLTTDMIFRY